MGMEKWKLKMMEWMQNKKGKKEQLLILLLLGILLIVIAIPVERENSEIIEKTEEMSEEGGDVSFATQMETQLEMVLRNVQGVGKVSVMITLAETSEKIIEKDAETSVQTSSGEGTGNQTSTDRKESAVYSGRTGEEIPYVIKEISPKVEGVLVVAEGGDNAVVIEEISEAVQALFGIDPHKIKVMKHN